MKIICDINGICGKPNSKPTAGEEKKLTIPAIASSNVGEVMG